MREPGWRGTRRQALVALWSTLAAARSAQAQTAFRISGTTHGVDSAPLSAAVELEAVYGYRGLEFVGQKTFTSRATRNGRWSVLGLTPGVWRFAAHAPGHAPQVFLLPVQFTQRNPLSAVGGQLPFDAAFELAAAPDGSLLARAADAVVRGRSGDVVPAFAELGESNDPRDLLATGEMALFLRAAELSRPFFHRAIGMDPAAGRAHLGLASAALMLADWDGAARNFVLARNLGEPVRLRRAIGAAITELQRISRVDGD